MLETGLVGTGKEASCVFHYSSKYIINFVRLGMYESFRNLSSNMSLLIL